MNQKGRNPHVRQIRLGHILDTLHISFAFAPVMASVFATLLRRELDYRIEVPFIIAVIILNFVILWYRWPKFFYTFRTDDLPPLQSGHEQPYDTEVAIIEDGRTRYYRDKVMSHFQTEIDLEQRKSALLLESKLQKAILVEPSIKTRFSKELEDLVFKQIEVSSPIQNDAKPSDHHAEKLEERSRDGSDYCSDATQVPGNAQIPIDSEHSSKDPKAEKEQKNFRNSLNDRLNRADAVVVVRSDNLDKNNWTYDAIDDWAYAHSEIPVLFVREPTDSKYSQDATADNFGWIRDDPKRLPWSLLRQATKRGKAWRDQATYNRAFVWNIFYISIMCIWIVLVWFVDTRKDLNRQSDAHTQEINAQRIGYEQTLDDQQLKYQRAMRATDEALVVERAYRQSHTTLKDDPQLSLSYWFRYDAKLFIFVTTENPHNTKSFESNHETIIGCGFLSYPNHVIKWEINDKTPTVYNAYGEIESDSKCEMKKLGTSDIKGIVCATYNGTNNVLDADRTVGICVFTTNHNNNIFAGEYRQFLRREIARFDTNYMPLIRSHQLLTLEQRER